MTPLDQIPDVKFVAVAATQQYFRIHSILHHAGRPPFAGDDAVESQVPPEIISKFLRATIQLPLPEDIETLLIHYENSAGTAAVRSSQRADKDSVGTAMNRVRGCVSCARSQRLRLNHLHDLRFARIRFGVDDMDARRIDTSYHQVSAFRMGTPRVRAQPGPACVPPEMMQLVAGIRHVHLADNIAVTRGFGIDVHNA